MSFWSTPGLSLPYTAQRRSRRKPCLTPPQAPCHSAITSIHQDFSRLRFNSTLSMGRFQPTFPTVNSLNKGPCYIQKEGCGKPLLKCFHNAWTNKVFIGPGRVQVRE